MIMEDMAISVQIGDRFTGAQPTFTSAAYDFMAIAKKFEAKDTTEKTNVQGAGSPRKKHRYHSDESTLTMEGVVPVTGSAFPVDSGSAVRRNCKVITHPNSTLQNSRTYIGVITTWTASTSQGEAQMETVEVDLEPDYTPGP